MYVIYKLQCSGTAGNLSSLPWLTYLISGTAGPWSVEFAPELSGKLVLAVGTSFPSPSFPCSAQCCEKKQEMERGSSDFFAVTQAEAAQGNPAQQRLMWPTYNCVKRCHSAPLSKRLLLTARAPQSPAPSAKHSFLALNHHCPLASCLEFAHYTEEISNIYLYIFKMWQIVL